MSNGKTYKVEYKRPRYDEKKLFMAWSLIFIIPMFIFTFLDLPLAKSVLHYNDLYGEIFQIIGLIPTCITGTFFAIGNLRTREIAKKPVLSAVISIIAVLFFTGFTLLSVFYLNRPFFVPMIVFNFAFILFSVYANRKLCKKADLFEMRKVMLIALIATLAAVLGQTLVKFAFNRPRFITLTDPDTQFTYWFIHHPFAADSSFPSGHAAQAALTFLLLYFYRLYPSLKTRKWDITLGIIALILTGSTMLSRMFLGAHYATDVWAGCFLTLGTISLAHHFVERYYMLPKYRLSMIREKVMQLQEMVTTDELRSAYASIINKLDIKDFADERNEVVIRLFAAKEEVEATLKNSHISSREKSGLKTIRHLIIRFLKEICSSYDGSL